MNIYKVEVKKTIFYELEVPADGGYEAARKAEEMSDEWELIEENSEAFSARFMRSGPIT